MKRRTCLNYVPIFEGKVFNITISGESSHCENHRINAHTISGLHDLEQIVQQFWRGNWIKSCSELNYHLPGDVYLITKPIRVYISHI